MNEPAVRCMFCSAIGERRSAAHVVPESLGGRGAPIGQQGVTCDKCNQYFGQKVESKALRSFPFIGFRVIAGIPSKKGGMPSLATSLGTIHATGRHGIVELDPHNQKIASQVTTEEVRQLRVLAEVTEPMAVCRMLLKIGLEQLGKHFYEVATSERVRAAREFARQPKRGERWWFILQSKPGDYILGSRTPPEFSIELVEREGVLFSVMRMTGVSTLVPLEQTALPPTSGELSEPEFRTVLVIC